MFTDLNRELTITASQPSKDLYKGNRDELGRAQTQLKTVSAGLRKCGEVEKATQPTPLSTWICSKTPRRCQKPQILPNPKWTVLYIHSYNKV